MGIFSGGYAVRGPAGMGDSDGSRDRLRIDRILKHLDLADGAKTRQVTVVQNSQPRGIVASVLEPS
jgi:hypothetical protein